MTRIASFLSVSVAAGAAFALFVTAPVQVQAQNTSPGICLNVTEIKNTHVTNARTIMYQMRDGKVWRNTLATPCPDLVSQAGGYTQKAHTSWICANSQTITVNATGMVCRLGAFTRVS